MDEPQMLTADEVAAILRVDKERIYEMAKRGLLPVVRLGRQLRFNRAELQTWIQSGGKALPGGWRREAPAGVA